MTATATESPAGARPLAPVAAWPADVGHHRRWWILSVLVAVAFMAQLDLFVVNIAVPAISHSFHGASLSSLSWTLNGYAIVFAALLVPAGRLADHLGRRRFLLVGVVVFTLGSALYAVAPSIAVLVAARVLQAVGTALIVPTSLGLLLPVFPARQHTMVVGIWAGVAAVAASAGLPVGGLLVGLSWRWIFLINLPIGAFTLVAGWKLLPEIKGQRGARLPNPASVASLLAAVTLLILATVQGQSWGWSSPLVIGLYAGAALAAAVTVQRTIRHPHALIEASLFRSREFTSASIALLLYYVAFAAWLLLTVLYLQDLWHYSAVRAGLAIAPGPAMAALFSVNSGRIAGRVGRTVPALSGPLLVAASAAYWLLVAPAHPDYVTGFLPGLLIAGAGAGLGQAPLFAAASTLPAERATTGSAVLNASRQVGSAIGIAVLVALMGRAHPATLAPFRRGWLLEIGAGIAASAVIVAVRRPRPAA